MNHDKRAGLARRGILWNSDRSGSEALFPHLETVSVNHRAASSLSSSKLL